MIGRTDIVRFGEAFDRAAALLRDRGGELDTPVVLLRDIGGRMRLYLGGPPRDEHARFARELSARLGRFGHPAEELVVYREEMFAPETVFDDPDRLPLPDAPAGIFVLDRQVVGQDWSRAPLDNAPPRPPRVALFGMKGGVGRSTALAVWARHLAEAGRRVLVVDLDLESPGVGTTLLPEESQPEFGLVDWFVEDAVGQADEALLRDMVGSSPLSTGAGEVRVAPAVGAQETNYLAKLARTYTALPGPDGPEGFGARLARMVDALEAAEQPDIVLLDSRAGLHDIAAATVTRLRCDLSLLFAVHSPQTWAGYRHLLNHWKRDADLARRVRESLQLVAATIPETGRDDYLGRFGESAWTLLQETLYDEVPPGGEADFSFALEDPEAPHTPLRIHWHRAFLEYDPVAHPEAVTPREVAAAYGDFLAGTERLLARTEDDA